MPARRWFQISLAAKCQLLFGAAVLSIITASLIMPGIRMDDLTLDGYLRTAKEMATIALLTTNLPSQEDWAAAQETLNRNWPRLAKLGEFPGGADPPRLIPLAEAQTAAALGAKGFIYETLNQLQADPQALYRFKVAQIDEGHDAVRLAMAVRASEVEAQPGALKGMIEVHVPISPDNTLTNVLVLAAAVASGGLLALLVFYLVTQRLLLSPVRKLRRLAERVTTGDIEARSTIATGDEFEDLGQAFNDMLVHLQTSQDELRKINKSLDTRLGELAETNVALFESNRLKSEFIANVSHELRTPLVSIIGFAELLTDASDRPPADHSRLQRFAGNILISGRMLLEIINDLLDLAKIEAGRLELHVSDLEVPVLCDALIDFLRPLADKKNLSLSLQLGEDLPRMSSDAGRIKQVLYNLLSNAIKFTPEGGSISLAVSRADTDSVRFAVTDTGPGIPRDQQSLIFEKFRQIDSSVTREYGGTGLGLAITKELCTMLGGVVTMTSEVGQGSTFTVTLPAHAPSEAFRQLVDLT